MSSFSHSFNFVRETKKALMIIRNGEKFIKEREMIHRHNVYATIFLVLLEEIKLKIFKRFL